MIYEKLGSSTPFDVVTSGISSGIDAGLAIYQTVKISEQSRDIISDSRDSVADAYALKGKYASEVQSRVDRINATLADRENNPVRQSTMTNKLAMAGGLAALLMVLS